MLGLTRQDAAQIRAGRNRAIGARYALPLFWLGALPSIFLGLVGLAAAAFVAWGALRVWDEVIHPAVESGGVLVPVAVLVVAVLVVVLARAVFGGRRGHRGR